MPYPRGTKIRAIDDIYIENEQAGVSVEIPAGDVLVIASDDFSVGVDAESGQHREYQLVSYRSQKFLVRVCDFAPSSS